MKNPPKDRLGSLMFSKRIIVKLNMSNFTITGSNDLADSLARKQSSGEGIPFLRSSSSNLRPMTQSLSLSSLTNLPSLLS